MSGLSLITKGMITKTKDIFVGGAGVGLHKYDDNIHEIKPEINVLKFKMSKSKIKVTEDMVKIISAKILI